MTPMRKARFRKQWTLAELISRLEKVGEKVDLGNLSRIERGKQAPSTRLAEALAKVYGKKFLTEMEVLYPERYKQKEEVA